MTTRLLAIDSATEVLHLALVCGDQCLVQRVAGGAQASATLLPTVAALLAEAGTSLRALDAFAFGRGPGAFTGLRTACSVVQGWALGTDRPVLPIDTLLIVAEAARRAGAGAPVWAVSDARMGELYLARYAVGAVEDTAAKAARDAPGSPAAPVRAPAHRLAAPDWLTLVTPHLLPLAEGARFLQQADGAVAGTALQSLAPAFEGLGARAWAQCEPDGAALAALALAAHARGEGLDAAQAWPLYVRDKVAYTTAERAAQPESGRPAAAAGPAATHPASPSPAAETGR